MKYFLDTEFLEGPQKTWFGKSKPTIDLISIGIVSEDEREYYAVSNDFNLKEAWNRYQIKDNLPDSLAHGKQKEYWIRENVLKPIFNDLFKIHDSKVKRILGYNNIVPKFDYKTLKLLLKIYGKSNEQIAKEIIEFTHKEVFEKLKGAEIEFHNRTKEYGWNLSSPIEFYAYYADYDWVVFCWLFGKMIDLPKGFPMYCRDLKQILDEKAKRKDLKLAVNDSIPLKGLDQLKQHPNYPKQTNEHNALADARWNLELYKFLENL